MSGSVDADAQASLDAETVARLRAAVLAGLPNGARVTTLSAIEAAISQVIEAMEQAERIADSATLNALLDVVLVAQRRALEIPDGPESASRFQALASAWTTNAMPDAQRRLYERNMIAANIQFRLRVFHPELGHPPQPDPDATRLYREMNELSGPLMEALAHTVPGTITSAWLDTLGRELERHRALLATAAAGNPFRSSLCFTMATAADALGRGLLQMARSREARDAYAEAERLYTEAGEPEHAARAAEQARWLEFALTADIDGASFEDLRRMADGIADPFERARTLSRLGRRATEANDQGGALRYAAATAAAMAEAGFPDPASEPMMNVMSAWVAAACGRRSGLAVGRLLQQVSDMMDRVLVIRHADEVRRDPARAARTEAVMARLHAALRAVLAQQDAVAAEVHETLRRYVPDMANNDEPPTDPAIAGALALWPRLNAIEAAAGADEEPNAAIEAEARAVVAAAQATAQPGLTASAYLAQARLLERRGDLAGSAAAAEAGESALRPDGAEPETLTDPALFSVFLTLRQHRVGLATGNADPEALLDLTQGAIRAIEAVRYRINDPYQQGAYLAERSRFYEMAAFAAFKLERWDDLIEVMDLFRSRSALQNRLAPPPEDDAAALMAKVATATRAIEAAPDDKKQALRENRRILWSLLSIARMRGAVGRTLPRLTVAAVREALEPDEAVVSWVWVADGVLLVLALDKTRVHAERVVLTDTDRSRLRRYVNSARNMTMPIETLGQTIEQLTDAILPEKTRAFIAGAARLILSPHRTLHLLPFHAARIDGQFLIERATVRYVPNLGSMLIPWCGTRDGGVIAVGIDEFGRDNLPTLKNAEAEARTVVATWAARGVEATALIGPDATRSAFAALPLERCSCLHLATHGSSVIADESGGDPFLSRLCLRDGDLEALSLADMPLRAELVVMSACYSGQRALDLPGLGELPGDDLFGLQAALFQAGVRGVIGALWPLHDESALALMPVLHEHLAGGSRPEVALREAVRAYLRGPAARGVFFWAPLFMSSIGRMGGPAGEATR